MKKFKVYTQFGEFDIEAGTIQSALSKFHLQYPYEAVASIHDLTFDDIER